MILKSMNGCCIVKPADVKLLCGGLAFFKDYLLYETTYGKRPSAVLNNEAWRKADLVDVYQVKFTSWEVLKRILGFQWQKFEVTKIIGEMHHEGYFSVKEKKK